MKKMIITLATSLLLFPLPNYAVPLLGSPYAGAEGGLAFMNEPNKFTTENDYVLAGRLFLGYQSCMLFAIEAGYDYFQNHSFKGKNDFQINNFKLSSYDASIRITSPTLLGVKLYSSLGGVFIKQEFDVQLKGQQINQREAFSSIFPTTGVGLLYFFNPHLAARLSWTHTFGHGETKSNNLIPLGISFYL